MKKLICKIFGHKTTLVYPKNNPEIIDIYCKRCHEKLGTFDITSWRKKFAASVQLPFDMLFPNSEVKNNENVQR